MRRIQLLMSLEKLTLMINLNLLAFGDDVKLSADPLFIDRVVSTVSHDVPVKPDFLSCPLGYVSLNG